MKTYDEIVSNVVEATAAHRRKVKRIQRITATSVMCAVCVFGLSVYMNLEPQQTLPSETETQTVTETETAETEKNASGQTDAPADTNPTTEEADRTETEITGTQPESITQPETAESVQTEEIVETTAPIATETHQTTGKTTERIETDPTTEKPHTTTRRQETGTTAVETTFWIPNIDQTGVDDPPTEDTTEEPPCQIGDPDTTEDIPYTTTAAESTTTTTTTTTTAIPTEAQPQRTVGTVTIAYKKETE